MSQVNLDRAYDDLLPEGESVLPSFGVRLVAFYDEEGSLKHQFSIDQFENSANAPISMLIGIIELLQLRLASLIED